MTFAQTKTHRAKNVKTKTEQSLVTASDLETSRSNHVSIIIELIMIIIVIIIIIIMILNLKNSQFLISDHLNV